MAYSKQTWNNNDSTTPLSGPRLNHLETQYDESIAAVSNQIAGSVGSVHTALEARLASFTPSSGGTTSGGLDFTLYGIKPVVSYNGTTWQARASLIPTGYSGNVDYDSTGYLGAPSPADMIAGDKWDRQVS